MKRNRFTAMSKLLGIFIACLSIVIVIYAMIEMHVKSDLSALPALIGGILAIFGSYCGFYINMAKAEHIEDKKNELKKELALLRIDGITEEEETKEKELLELLDSLDSNLKNITETEESVDTDSF